jgi:hypothetical protein
VQAAEAVDHLVLACPDLDAGVAYLRELTGVTAAGGGSHPRMGTRNALASLGGQAYLEVIAPDPAQPSPERPRPFGIDQLALPRLVTWAVRAEDIDQRVADARAGDYEPGPIMAMSRRRPDGLTLHWRLTRRDEPAFDGLVPFLIAWGGTPHPSADTPRGLSLATLRAEHPAADDVRRMLASLGLEMEVSEGPTPRLTATLQTRRGAVELS